MHRLVLLAVVLALSAPIAARPPDQQSRRLQADGLVRLLSDLETALQSGGTDAFAALAAPDLPAEDAARFARLLARGPATTAVIRERARRPVTGGVEVLAEVLVGHDRRGRIATWQLRARPRAESDDAYEIYGLAELGAVDGLIRLDLDTDTQYAVHDLTYQAPDLVVSMKSGTAFVARSDAGVTALVLRGRGSVRFTPPSAAEQGQLRLFNGRPDYESDIDEAFIRLSPLEFDSRIESRMLEREAVDPGEIRRAQDVFDDRSPRTYSLELDDLGPDTWSLEPAIGSTVVELRTRRHGWLTYARSPSEPEDVSFFDREKSRNISVYTSADRLAERGPFYDEDDDAAYDVDRVGLDLTFDPERQWVSGRGSLRVTVRRDQVATLTIRLAEPLAIASVSTLDFGRLLALRIKNQNKAIISFPQPLEAGRQLILDVVYSGRLPPQRLNREAIAPEGQVMGSAQDPFGIDRPIIIPEPRFMYSNRVAWYPQNERTDFATAAMRFTVPSEFQVVASGTLVNSTITEVPAPDGGDSTFRRTVEFDADRPARYMALVISRFVPIDQRSVPVPAVAPPVSRHDAGMEGRGAGAPAIDVEVLSTPRITGRNRPLADRVSALLADFARTVGEAPYPDFTLAGIDDNLPGGHSPAYFAVLHQPLPTTPYSWTSDPVSFDNVYQDFFLAHEVAHQWWGQAVGWKNYHEQWLSEGLAQYFAVLAAEHDRGRDTAEGLISRMRDSALALEDQGPIYLGYRLGHIEGEGRVFRAIVYNKSAVVLDMLRRLMGDEGFFAGLREFYATWRFRKAGTDDFRDAMQHHTTIDVGRFLDRWILGAVIPKLKLDARLSDDGRTAIVRVEQQQTDVFDLPLTLTIRYADGAVETRSLPITEASVERRLTLPRQARRIDIRQELSLFRR
ncbi:MAG: M1 family aminopeptidase [Vicinamibacterales bacterium]